MEKSKQYPYHTNKKKKGTRECKPGRATIPHGPGRRGGSRSALNARCPQSSALACEVTGGPPRCATAEHRQPGGPLCCCNVGQYARPCGSCRDPRSLAGACGLCLRPAAVCRAVAAVAVAVAQTTAGPCQSCSTLASFVVWSLLHPGTARGAATDPPFATIAQTHHPALPSCAIFRIGLQCNQYTR